MRTLVESLLKQNAPNSKNGTCGKIGKINPASPAEKPSKLPINHNNRIINHLNFLSK